MGRPRARAVGVVARGPALDVLHELGLTHAEAERRWLAGLLNGEPPLRSKIDRGRSVGSSPAWSRLDGWACGFALAFDREPNPEDVLLGLCWVDSGRLAGVARETVVAALAARGVRVPSVRPPADASLGSSERVDVPRDRLTEVRRSLLDGGRLVAFNFDPDNDAAWVYIPSGDADARALIDGVLGSDEPTE